MANFATDCSDVEMGPVRTDTFETLVAEPELPMASASPPLAASNSFPSCDGASSSTTTAEGPKGPDWNKAQMLEDVKRFTRGFPRLSAQQTQAHNGSIHPRFETPGELLITYREYQVGSAAKRVYEYYSKHPEVGRRLTIGQRKAPGETCVPEEIDILMEVLEEAWLKYDKLLMAQRQKRTLLGVHREEVRGFYGHFLASQDMTDKDVFMSAYGPHQDHCTTAVDQVPLAIKNLLYSDFAKWFQKKFTLLKYSEDSGGFLLSLGALARVIEVFQVFLSSSMLLVPVGILLFGGLDKRGMFEVVIASVLIFSAVVVLGRGGGIGEAGGGSGHGSGLLLGVGAAYTAVLVTFLAQLGS